MLRFICRNARFNVRSCSPFLQQLFLLRNNPSVLPSRRFFSSNIGGNEHSFTVSYLINACGLSLESAISASKLVHFETPHKADSVVASLKYFGFSQTQISVLVKKNPKLLSSGPTKKILPKLEFLHSKGFTYSDIIQILCYRPFILNRSLKNHIIPSYNYLKDLLQSDIKTVAVIKRSHSILYDSLQKKVVPSINCLRNNGVPKTHIGKLLCYWPLTLAYMSLDRVKSAVEKAREMGIDPSKVQFVRAVYVLAGINTSTWERKVAVLKIWNLSEEEILLAFKRHPLIMITSENKIMAVMDLFVNQLGWKSTYIVKCPVLIGLSLEKRLIPRASVLQSLVSKGLVKKDYRSAAIFAYPEIQFLQKFVNCYDEAPELLKVYHEKLTLLGKQRD